MPRSVPMRKDTEAEERWTDACADCLAPDPHTRSAHQLHLARLGGLESVREHLHRYWAQRLTPDDRRERIDAVCAWLGHLMAQYAGLVDPDTGRSLPWWEVRQYVASRREAIAQQARERAPARQPLVPRPVEGFTLSPPPPRLYLVPHPVERHDDTAWPDGWEDDTAYTPEED